jgi:hypothetical protein
MPECNSHLVDSLDRVGRLRGLDVSGVTGNRVLLRLSPTDLAAPG